MQTEQRKSRGTCEQRRKRLTGVRTKEDGRKFGRKGSGCDILINDSNQREMVREEKVILKEWEYVELF